jgi:hypothetical protein
MLPMLAVSVGASVLGGIMGGAAARDRERAAAAARRRAQAELTSLENSRQAIINPYETVKDMSYMASNPYANLSVATQAARFEAEQIDISLANTLDTLRETGASAGGATALAQASLKAKQGISASIESQEAQNEKLRAQGEAELDRIKMAEAARVQQAEAQGKAFMFEAREEREVAKMDRVAAQLQQAQAQQMQAQADRTGALTGMISGITSALGTGITASGAKTGGNSPGGFKNPGFKFK